jgi:N4-gp56 family major capsid protein
MALTTTGQIGGPVNVLFQVNLLRNAKALCPYFTGTTPGEVSEHQGTFTAKWRRIENLTPKTTPLAELTGSLAFPTRTPDQPTVTDVTATVQKFGNFIFLNEEVDLVNFNGQAEKFSEVLGINAGQSLNRLQRNIAEDNLTVVFGRATATTATGIHGAGITRADLQKTVNALHNNIAMKFTTMTGGSTNIGTSPIRASYWAICHVDTEEDVRGLTGFTPVENYVTQTQDAEGEFGHVGGSPFISTTDASIDADSRATTT